MFGRIRHRQGLFLWIALAGLLALARPVCAQHIIVFHNFGGSQSDGSHPRRNLTRDASGSLYGTTFYGGAYGQGVVFKLDPSGNETILHTFTGGADGGISAAGLWLDTQENLYGATTGGGAYGAGVVFKLDPSGNETVLYNFAGGKDGGTPWGGVVQDAQGNLYGTTRGGGVDGAGVVFKLDPSGNETVLYTFTGGVDGGDPWAGVIRDSQGNLYGTTRGGGAHGGGVVFKVDPSGKETVRYAFTGGVDGGDSWDGLIQDAQGNLYGTTDRGGADGAGVVFEVDPSGNEMVLHTFTGGSDGANPQCALIMDGQGNLYGTTTAGGSGGNGTIFSLDPMGNFTVLHTFSGSDGSGPPAAVTADSQGNLYGVTWNGGMYGSGNAFEISPGVGIVSASVSPASLAGGASATGTVTLSAAAPAGGTVVNLSSSNPTYVSVPATVTVPEGQSSATFPVTTSTVSSTLVVNVTGTVNGTSQSATMTLYPLLVNSVSLHPNSVIGGDMSTGTISLNFPAPSDATVTLSSDNAAASVPASVTVPAGQSSATFPVSTSAVASTVTAHISAMLNGSSQSAGLTIRPIGVQSVALAPNVVTGGDESMATVTLQRPAAPGDITVQLTSSNPAVARLVFYSVTVPAGSQSVTVPVKTRKVAVTTNVMISATANGVSGQGTLTVQPPRKGWVVKALSITPKSIHGGSSAAGKVTLNATAPAGGLTVTLTSSDPSIVMVPSVVTIPAGSSSGKFSVNTSSVTSSTTVQVTASGNGTSKTTTVTVNP